VPEAMERATGPQESTFNTEFRGEDECMTVRVRVEVMIANCWVIEEGQKPLFL